MYLNKKQELESLENQKNHKIDELRKLNFKLNEQARREFIKQKYKTYYSLLWEHEPEKILTVLPMDLKELKIQTNLLKLKSSRKKHKNYFVTITTPPETDKLKFINGIKKLFDNAVIDRGYLVFEQRGETISEIGKGLHAHLLIFRNDKYTNSKFTNRLLAQLIKLEINEKYKSVKQLLKMANMKSSPFSYQNIKDETVSKKLAYILGDKNDEKLEKVKMDSEFRKTFDLLDIYKKNI